MHFTLLFMLFIGSGSVWSVPHHTADHSNHCHIEDAENKTHHVEVGEKISLPGKCQEVTCEKDFSFSSLTCPAVSVKSGCSKTEIDYSKPYPDCCPKVDCKEEK